MSDNKKILKNLLNFGVNLNLDSEAENIYYAQCFTRWMMQQEDFDANMASDSEIEVYFLAEMVMMVNISDSTLTLEPHSESAFDAVLMVLKFISERHDTVQKEFKKLSTDELTEDLPVEDFGSVEEDSSEDDSEWI
jgi:hypothetical protein